MPVFNRKQQSQQDQAPQQEQEQQEQQEQQEHQLQAAEEQPSTQHPASEVPEDLRAFASVLGTVQEEAEIFNRRVQTFWVRKDQRSAVRVRRAAMDLREALREFNKKK